MTDLAPVPLNRSIAPPTDAERAALLAEALELASQRKASSTMRAYAKDWAIFLEWCNRFGAVPLPAEGEDVALFVSEQARDRKVTTVARRLSAISFFHNDRGHPSPVSHNAVIYVMEGLRRTHDIRPTQKAPILPEDLRAMIRSCPDTLAGQRDRAILALCFAGAFRRSELVAINVEDVREVPRGLEIDLWSSKTDQQGVGELVAIPAAQKKPDACSVALVTAWIAGAQLSSGPLFRQMTKSDKLAVGTRDSGRLSDRSIANIVKATATRIGLDPDTVAGHSLRIGFITAASDGGAPTRTIMVQTRHKTAAMIDRYYRKEDKFTDNANGYTGL